MLRNRLKYFRHQKMMNQTEFAKFLGVSKYMYNQWELQKRQPSLENVWEISKRLKIKIEELFEEVLD